MIAAQNSITAQRFGRYVFLDPGIYVAALGSALEFDVQRASYSQPRTITQVIHLPDGSTQTVALPSSVLAGWSGLRNFLHLKVTNSSGKVVASRTMTFCPNVGNPQKAVPDGAVTSPYPFGCRSNPFQLGSVWGVANGWGADPIEFSGARLRLSLGTYHVTETIAPKFVQLLNISAADATATVKVKVVKGTGCCGASHRSGRAGARSLPRLPSAPTLTNPPPSALPDLVPLPSFGIRTSHTRATSAHPASDHLNFGANVWIDGNAQLDVQGFRSNGSPVMKAYQYFWQDGQIIGRARAGTMGFDNKHGAQPLALRAVRAVPAAQRRQVTGRAEPQGGVLHRPDGRDQPGAAERGVAAAVPRVRYVRLADDPVGPGSAAARLGRHLRSEPRRSVVRHHPSAQRHVLHRGHRQPGASAVRDDDE
jgi:hypothetical protein